MQLPKNFTAVAALTSGLAFGAAAAEQPPTGSSIVRTPAPRPPAAAAPLPATDKPFDKSLLKRDIKKSNPPPPAVYWTLRDTSDVFYDKDHSGRPIGRLIKGDCVVRPEIEKPRKMLTEIIFTDVSGKTKTAYIPTAVLDPVRVPSIAPAPVGEAAKSKGKGCLANYTPKVPWAGFLAPAKPR